MPEPDAAHSGGEPHEPRVPARRLTPGWRVWLTIAVVLVVTILARSDRMDPAVRLILLRIGAGISALILWVWFVCCSGHSPRIRRWVGWGTVAAALVLLAAVRVERTSGRLQMEFAWRWSPHRDELLDRDLASRTQRGTDLVSTTPRDFPQFLGPTRNSFVAGIQLDRDWSSHPPRLVWQHEIGAGWSGFAAVNRSAVTLEQRGDLELITCYDVESGELNWSHAVKARHATTLGYVGPRSTPTIHEGRVYTFGATGVLTCLDGADGGVIWQRNLLQDHQLTIADAEQAVAWGRAASPLVYQDIVIVPLGGDPNGPKVGLIALNQQDGKTRWTGGNYQAAYSSPMLAVLGGIEQILIVNEDVVSAHDPSTGDVLWDHPWPGKSNMDANVSQPAPVDDSHVLLSKGYGHGAELIEVRQEQGEWFVESVWQEKVMKTKFSNVALSDGHAYGLDDGILSCVDVWTGERKWKQGRYGYGQILMVEKLLLVLSERGELALVEATPARFHELGRINALDGQTWNTLCLLGDRLLLRNAEMAACYQLAMSDEL